MNHIKKEMTLKEIVNTYPETIDFFNSKGFKGLDNKNLLNTIGKITIQKALEAKKINVDTFLELLNDIIEQDRNSEDVNLSKKISDEGAVSVMGLLPCPVKNPLLEGLKKFQSETGMKINHELKAASSGLDWLKEDVIKANHPEKLADMFISAGFDLFFEDELMGKFKHEGIFKDITGLTEYNKDFNNENISLKDPDGDYSMLAVVPAVFLVNTDALGDRPFPKSWADLLKPEFENSVSLPISDFDLFNAILISIYKNYGEDGVKKLGKTLLQNMHPSQMVKSNKLKVDVPAVTIMPYFFTKMTGQGGPMVAQWPEDGAALSPIFMLTKKSKEKELKPLADFFASKEIGEILSHQGLFPTVNPEVENNLGDKKFMWVGWDYIKNNDIGAILKHCEKLFFQEAKKA
ncbi:MULTISPECIES: ABC transporter substrate-binding protein [Psychrilyobacter]|uniref:Extracellular solute-binding protein n=1 Tax=Psychrilyobacter piezotolerans TaxID=2293438 RepID=A0ABX9KFB9_9FUSO|nr:MULTISPECIES: ABC transporter substrate-binding protein [Psychrilyobacter]MCS5423179.1 ABC transporter substrate-binding protein [Psychrilyobacter sp. S5]NDI78630.1 ABC transporter substrate-binding protein [Psychrilyobacter piezotolerans]RDE59981.1 extracellular solute-binding protein [Psychrilyobacter sp. S5]REI40208.1 extracellular solute-binding protein [Psychrilyobacter piezotolerans]